MDPLFPLTIEEIVISHGHEPMAVVEPVARERLEAVEEEPLRRGPLGPVAGLAGQQRKRRAHVEAPLLALCLGHDECLEGGEVVRHAGHGGRERADELEFGHQIVDRHRQLGGCQHLLADRNQRFLHGNPLLKPFRQRPKEVGLFDVFFAVEHGRPVAGGAKKRVVPVHPPPPSYNHTRLRSRSAPTDSSAGIIHADTFFID